ncbi:MAG: DMT family transporter [Inquilinaceae bacterium]
MTQTRTEDAPARTAGGGGRWALAALAGGALAIAFAPIFVRLADVGPMASAFWRPALALPALALWLAVEQQRRPVAPRRPVRPVDRLALVLAGLLFAGDLAAWHWSIRHTSVANSTLLANLAPVFVATAGWLWFGERFTRAFLVGLALALAGAVLLMSGSLTVDPDHLAGDAVALVTAMFYAGYILAVGRLRGRFSTATIMTWSALVTALVLLPLAWLSGETLVPATAVGWAVLAGLALISHAGGQSLIAFALAHLPVTFSAVGLLLQPVAAAVLAWLLLGEAIGPLQAVGGAVVLAGIAVARRGSARSPSRRGG